jgi:nitroreductase
MNEHASLLGTEHVAATIRSRRTNLRIDRDRPVDPALLNELMELATWAPNHHLTEPWRFAVITGDARATLGALTADYQRSIGVTDEAKLDKTRGKFTRSSVMLLVASEPSAGASAATRLEDRDATSAAVQNLMLAATAHGLATYWGTGAVCEAPAVKEWCGFSADADVVAAIYLGYAFADVPVPTRSAPQVLWLTGTSTDGSAEGSDHG